MNLLSVIQKIEKGDDTRGCLFEFDVNELFDPEIKDEIAEDLDRPMGKVKTVIRYTKCSIISSASLLHLAAYHKNESAILDLMERGADPRIRVLIQEIEYEQLFTRQKGNLVPYGYDGKKLMTRGSPNLDASELAEASGVKEPIISMLTAKAAQLTKAEATPAVSTLDATTAYGSSDQMPATVIYDTKEKIASKKIVKK